MTDSEWLDGLRHLSNDQILKVHFELQEKIKKHYKQREKGNNLEKAIALCEQQIALAPLSIKALKSNPALYTNGEFFTPRHHGFTQLSVILKKRKELDKLQIIQNKMKMAGWIS
ncbi:MULTISPECIES: hypothetical protein [Enterobacter cloacae complex]|uniref:hypothetical protein n=1 Tax=Enterobacter cloacae complex TaxID=354276 RepID=UPI002006A800|nr:MULTISPECIES: hypothetical protein [Enterobacter cloacae complex]MCK7106450.1 hypothetical protein [Enterobacter kobei]UQQ51951.1 hypothetical protein MUY33_04680 [Enterobacter roggenkampii]